MDTYNFLNDYGITTGQFNGIELGDYIEIQHDYMTTVTDRDTYPWFTDGYSPTNKSFWAITDIDKNLTYYNSTTTNNSSMYKHHVDLISVSALGYVYNTRKYMGTYSNTTISNFWYNSYMNKTIIPEILTKISNVISTIHMDKEYLSHAGDIQYNVKSMIGCNANGANIYTNSDWFYVWLPNEQQLTGYSIHHSSHYDNSNGGKLKLFNLISYNRLRQIILSNKEDRSTWYMNAARGILTSTFEALSKNTSENYYYPTMAIYGEGYKDKVSSYNPNNTAISPIIRLL